MTERLPDETLYRMAGSIAYGFEVNEAAMELLARRKDTIAEVLQAENERLRAALKAANGALADIADGEPEFSDEGELVWCRNRAAEAWRITRAALSQGGAA